MDLLFLNEQINKRYLTLEGNIKAKSNSFYDSYLDLLECTIKYILDENDVSYDQTKTCGHIIKEEQVKSFLLYEIKIDECTYSKLPDYIKKCNDHKHKKEKNLQLEGVLNFMQLYFNFLNCYLKFKKINLLNFDCNYYTLIFNEVEKNEHMHNINYIELTKKTENLEEKVDVIYEKVLREKKELEEKERIIWFRNFSSIANKKFIWHNQDFQFKKVKSNQCLLYLLMFIIISVSIITIYSEIGILSFISIVVKIFYFLFLLLFEFIGILRLKKVVDTGKVFCILNEHFALTNLNYFKRTNRESIIFNFMRKGFYLFCIMNIILIVDEFTIASIIPLIFEVLSFVVVFLYRKNLIILIDGYDRFVLFEHQNDNSCSYVYVEGINFYDKEEAIKKFNLDL